MVSQWLEAANDAVLIPQCLPVGESTEGGNPTPAYTAREEQVMLEKRASFRHIFHEALASS